MEIFNIVEKKRQRSASVDLSRDPQHRFDCYPPPEKTSVPSRKPPAKLPPYSINCARMKFWRGTATPYPQEPVRRGSSTAQRPSFTCDLECSSCCMSPAPHAPTLLQSRYLHESLISIAITGRMFLAAPICKSTRLRNLEASFPRAWLHEDQEVP
jgi:hypothetical protein